MKLVLDTNIVLDLFVFRDAAVGTLHEALANKEVEWVATAPMRDELACVLAYEQLGPRMIAANVSPQQVLAGFDEHARIVDAAPVSKFTCRDGDDQKFIDLALGHGARWLLSRDRAVLKLARRAQPLGLAVMTPDAWPAALINAG